MSNINSGQDVDGEDISPASVETDESNNTYYIDENDNPQTVIDDLRADYGSGVAELLPGVHTFNDVQVRNGITLKGPSPDHFSGDHAEVRPDGDVPAVRLDHNGGVAQVEDVWFNASNVAGYSSRLLLIPSGLVPYRVADNCAFEGPNSGVGIGWDDTAGSNNIGTTDQGIGPGWVRDCRFDSLGDAVTTTVGTGYVSRPGHLDCYWVDCGRIANEDPASGGGKYTGTIQPTANSDQIGQFGQAVRLDLETFDDGQFSNVELVNIQAATPKTKPDWIRDTNTPGEVYARTITPVPQRTKFDGMEAFNWQMGSGSLPHWLEATGDGNIQYGNFLTNIVSGSTSGNRQTVEPANLIISHDRQEAPRFHATVTANSTTSCIFEVGLRTQNDTFEAQFYADPTDSLGTGITGNWIFRVVDNDGTVLTETDTGVTLGTGDVPMSVVMYDNNRSVYGAIDESVVGKTALNSQAQYVHPHMASETTTSSNRYLTMRYEARLEYLPQT